MKIEKFVFSPFFVNTYLLYDETKECIIIDPACHTKEEKKYLKKIILDKNLKPSKVLNTHGHLDHIFGNTFFEDEFPNLKSFIHYNDFHWLEKFKDTAERYGIVVGRTPFIDDFIEENQIIRFGNSELKVIETPGHSSGSVSFYSEKDNFVIVGDILFRDSVGRVDLPTGDMNVLLESIKNKLFTLNKNTKVYSGHGEDTTIKYEIENNPFCK